MDTLVATILSDLMQATLQIATVLSHHLYFDTLVAAFLFFVMKSGKHR